VHPYGFRLGYTKTWKSRWFAKKGYADLLHEDLVLKSRLKENLKSAGVASIEIERPGNKLRITINTARPGIIIGRKGAEIDRLRQEVQKQTGREVLPINIQEVRRPELNAQLVAESICLQLEKRVAFRRAMRKAVDSALRFGCLEINGGLGEGAVEVAPNHQQRGRRHRHRHRDQPPVAGVEPNRRRSRFHKLPL
ncbi:MAG: 30S ribosomal protein S3, partial [Terriglobales bacterium]